jgi:hypothetical protein
VTLFFWVAVVLGGPATLVWLPETSSVAKCLDGSNYGYYYAAGDPARWLIHIQGGGWCYDENDCVGRSTTILGSSKQWPTTLPSTFIDTTGGIFSDNTQVNPHFANWTRVWFPYCDGASFAGYVVDPVKVNTTTLYFRGLSILNETFKVLIQTKSINTAKELVITGTSAGGLATYFHIDMISKLFPNTRVVGIPDAGYFMDVSDIEGHPYIREKYQYVFKMQNASGGVNQACIAAYSAADAWHCFFAPYTFPHVKTPLFIVNTPYDTWQLSNILVPPDDGQNWDSCINGQTQCTNEQLSTFQKFHDNVLLSFQSQGVLNRPGNGAFIPSCFIHALTIADFYWTTPKIGGSNMQTAVWNWYTGQRGSHFLVDCDWPCNKDCSNTK